MSPELRVEGPLATITLRRPEVANRLERDDLDVMLAHLDAIERNEQVRVLVLRSQGRHFCSGFNLEELWAQGSARDPQLLALSAPRHFAQVADALERTRPVSLAVMQGGAFGGAVDLALACDLRLGTAQGTAAVPAVRLGLQFYRSGLQRAVRRLPWPVAQQLFLLGRSLDAAALAAAGFYSEVLDDHAALEAAAQAWCEELLALAPMALCGIKRAMADVAAGRTDDPAVAAALDAAAARTERSADLLEGVQAWREGRAPRFRGC